MSRCTLSKAGLEASASSTRRSIPAGRSASICANWTISGDGSTRKPETTDNSRRTSAMNFQPIFHSGWFTRAPIELDVKRQVTFRDFLLPDEHIEWPLSLIWGIDERGGWSHDCRRED